MYLSVGLLVMGLGGLQALSTFRLHFRTTVSNAMKVTLPVCPFQQFCIIQLYSFILLTIEEVQAHLFVFPDLMSFLFMIPRLLGCSFVPIALFPIGAYCLFLVLQDFLSILGFNPISVLDFVNLLCHFYLLYT